MNMKKSLLALSTTAVVAIGGAGIAAADESAGDTPTTTVGSVSDVPAGDLAGSLDTFSDIAGDISKLAKVFTGLIGLAGN